MKAERGRTPAGCVHKIFHNVNVATMSPACGKRAFPTHEVLMMEPMEEGEEEEGRAVSVSAVVDRRGVDSLAGPGDVERDMMLRKEENEGKALSRVACRRLTACAS
jgi:hypothetical protein